MKLVDDMLVTSVNGQYSPPVSMGDNNSVMFEFWMVSATGLGGTGLTVSLEGSNDGLVWTAINPPAPATNNTAPYYEAVTATSTIIPWSQVRMKFTVDAGSALVCGSIRTYRGA
jgi:hypothetical protein